jgi:hypothetical protein
LELEKFGTYSKNETMEVQARYFDPNCYLFLLVKLKNIVLKISWKIIPKVSPKIMLVFEGWG